ncbi:MAG: hypothetical protein IKK53_01220 [Ruminiclostridium sp.]|nr:hypothetical protein [Ruminiclostridium sp.]
MKKTAYILAAAVLIAALSGCNGNSGDNDKPAETTKVTQVAFQTEEKEDTTEEALVFLKEQVPLFSKYLETRMQYPLSFETETETEDGIITAAIYIKDEKNMCHAAVDAFGNYSATIYTPEMTYIIVEANKTIYTRETTEEEVKKLVANNLLKIDADEAKAMSYVTDLDYFNDVLYKHEIIYAEPGVPTDYYFDENSEELVYIATENSTTRITKLTNEVTESAFELPSGYKTMTIEEYYEQLEAEQAAQTTAAE